VLKHDGLYSGINLPQDLLEDILKFAESASYIANGNPKYTFLLTNKREEELNSGKVFVSGHNFNPGLICPAIEKIEKDPKLLKIVADYLGTKPVLIGSQIRWSFPTPEQQIPEAQRGFFHFHYDLEDYYFVKFFFYLIDVDLNNSPHVCVKGTHKHKKLKHQFSLIREREDQEIIQSYGEENIVILCEKAGFGFVEDLYCFHKLAIPKGGERLILEIKFAMNSYDYR
jgi:hypothetical protein